MKGNTKKGYTVNHFNRTITLTRNFSKPQFMPTYNDMLDYIHRQSDSAKLVEEFDAVRQMARMHNSAYMYVRRWFLTRFPEMGQAA